MLKIAQGHVASARLFSAVICLLKKQLEINYDVYTRIVSIFRCIYRTPSRENVLVRQVMQYIGYAALHTLMWQMTRNYYQYLPGLLNIEIMIRFGSMNVLHASECYYSDQKHA